MISDAQLALLAVAGLTTIGLSIALLPALMREHKREQQMRDWSRSQRAAASRDEAERHGATIARRYARQDAEAGR